MRNRTPPRKAWRNRQVSRRVKIPDPLDPIQVAASDVTWWAKVTEREPFVAAALRIKRSTVPVLHVIWPYEGPMTVVYAEKPKPRRRQ